ncbi:MAG: biotin transporter BioY [Lachnospiraceae bacterium]|nr:biotin transporter BioY [Lachnospiraceae bacterium]
MTNNNNSFNLLDLCHIALFTALISVLAQISIPLPGGVPLTLQTFAVPLAGLILGAKRGTVSAILYVLLGAVGVPVFAGFSGGLGVVFGMTGGFIISFPLMALFAGFAVDKGVKSPMLWLWLVLGAVANYAVGTIWFMNAAGAGLRAALAACVLPFIPTAILKIILTGLLGRMLRGVLLKANLLKMDRKEKSIERA